MTGRTGEDLIVTGAGAEATTPRRSGLIRRLAADQRIRYLFVGGVNTVIGYGLFSLVQFTIGHVVTYFGSVLIGHLLTSILAFTLYRRLVFNVQGNLVVDFLRFQSVYLLPLAANLVALPLLVSALHWNVYLAQASIVIVTTIVSFVGHKYFSFRRAIDPEDAAESPAAEPREDAS